MNMQIRNAHSITRPFPCSNGVEQQAYFVAYITGLNNYTISVTFLWNDICSTRILIVILKISNCNFEKNYIYIFIYFMPIESD